MGKLFSIFRRRDGGSQSEGSAEIIGICKAGGQRDVFDGEIGAFQQMHRFFYLLIDDKLARRDSVMPLKDADKMHLAQLTFFGVVADRNIARNILLHHIADPLQLRDRHAIDLCLFTDEICELYQHSLKNGRTDILGKFIPKLGQHFVYRRLKCRKLTV